MNEQEKKIEQEMMEESNKLTRKQLLIGAAIGTTLFGTGFATGYTYAGRKNKDAKKEELE